MILVFYYAAVCVDGETGGEGADSATVTLDQQQGGAGDTEQQQQNADDAESEQAANAASGEQAATGEANSAAAENGECRNQTLAPRERCIRLKLQMGIFVCFQYKMVNVRKVGLNGSILVSKFCLDHFIFPDKHLL